MEENILDCNAAIEYSSREGCVLKKEIYKPCTIKLSRNERREIYLEVRGNKSKDVFCKQVSNVNVHKNFINEGKACIKFNNDKVNVMIFNAPPTRLFNFLKLMTVKLINNDEKKKKTEGKVYSSKSSVLDGISPLTRKEVEKAKTKLNLPQRVGNGKRPLSESRQPKAKKNCLAEMNKEELSEEQKEILEAAKSGQSFFFTGGAGTGKSHLLKSIIAALPPEGTYPTASTGVAACQIGGMTLHQFAGLGTGEGSLERCLELATRPNVRTVWKKCQRLIIDEISMVHGRFFEKLEHVARVVRNNEKPFGGIQLILCGDFFQLPPVSDKIVFCFETEAWEKCVSRCFELTEIHRQKDPALVSILRSIRMGKVTETICKQLQATSTNNIESNGILATRLCTHTADATAINNSKLEELEGKMQVYVATDEPSTAVSLLNKHCPVPSVLVLKIGAQVMLTKNIHVNRGLVNGARGVVVGFEADDVPVVNFSSVTCRVERDKFVTKFGDGRTVSRTQVPLTLAWAFSIHKSQGLTLDCVELSLFKVFEAGHAYVALSRVRSLDCLRLTDFDPNQVWANQKVLDYHKKFQRKVEISRMHRLKK